MAHCSMRRRQEVRFMAPDTFESWPVALAEEIDCIGI